MVVVVVYAVLLDVVPARAVEVRGLEYPRVLQDAWIRIDVFGHERRLLSLDVSGSSVGQLPSGRTLFLPYVVLLITYARILFIAGSKRGSSVTVAGWRSSKYWISSLLPTSACSGGTHAYAMLCPSVYPKSALVTYPTTRPSTNTGSYPIATTPGSSSTVQTRLRRGPASWRFASATRPKKSPLSGFTAKPRPAS